GLLYAGTETGMYISFDDGSSWQPFQLNLPIVPITDLTTKNNNLIAATQGRSFWLIDDLTPLHQLTPAVAASDQYLYRPLDSYRMGSPSFGPAPKNAGQNHPGGVMFHYFLKEALDSTAAVTLEISESSGELIKQFTNKPNKEKKDEQLATEKGMNRFVWNMRYPDAEKFDGLIFWGSGLTGPKAVPGEYKAKLTVNEVTMETDFKILADPRSKATMADMVAQFDFLIEVRDKLTETHQAIKLMREVKSQLSSVKEKIKEDENMNEIGAEADSLTNKMDVIEKMLYQTKNRSRQDPLNFPIRLNNKLAGLNQAGFGNNRPTDQAQSFKKEVTEKIDLELEKWRKILEQDIPRFNELVKSKGVDAVTAAPVVLPNP
ncbi:MAG: glycosyl hydrolase, partial [Cyclobacteriaceae bacterium]